MKSVFGWVAAIVLLYCGTAVWALAPQTNHISRAAMVIAYDPGGMISDYVRWFDRVRQAGVEVRIDGACISACTLVLSLPPADVCVTERGRFGFHLASVDGVADPETTKEIAAAFYPPAVLDWIEKHGPLVEAPIYLSGHDAIELGIVRECEP